LWVWGSGATGKLGLGPVAGKEECFASAPTPLVIGDMARVRSVSCGSAHTACVSDRGELFVWGSGDGGRLGLGIDRLATCFRPQRVDVNGECGPRGRGDRPGSLAFGGQKVAIVSCGNAHTLVATQIRDVVRGAGATRERLKAGGEVYMAGAQSVLGIYCPTFTKCEALAGRCINQISAGFSHCAAAAASGELFCWGSNYTGCCGAPYPTVQFCYQPYNVQCIFAEPLNLALGKPASQSSVYNGQDAFLGVDGNVDGSDPLGCTSTQAEAQPWWEVDLGDYCCITTIKIWNRTDEPHDPSLDRETFRCRLFPSYAMLSQEPFPRDRSTQALGTQGTLLMASLNAANARIKLTKNERCTVWHVPDNLTARFFRIMLEGYNFLHFAQLEVFGTLGMIKPVGKTGFVSCGRNATTVVIHPSKEPRDYDACYRRAVWADARNADILRQYESYALEFDKYGRGERIRKCAICKGGQLCEVCTLTERFRDELEVMPTLKSIGTERRGLDDMIQYLLDAPKPTLNYTPKEKKKGGMFGSMFGSTKDKKKDDKVAPAEGDSEERDGDE